MKHEHVMCQANDIKQKCLLGGNPTKKNQFFFPLSFIFHILPYFNHSLIFLLFYFKIEDNVVFKVWGVLGEFWFSLLFIIKKRYMFYLLNSH